LVLLIAELNRCVNGSAINCRYLYDIFDRYTCEFRGLSLPDEAINTTITIDGEHLRGMNRYDVEVVEFIDSDVSFVVSEIFDAFPNIQYFFQTNSGLTSIQKNAFRNTRVGPGFVRIRRCYLPTIQANAFLGLSTTTVLAVANSEVEHIHPNAFAGLTQARRIDLKHNKIRELPPQVFTSTRRLLFLELDDNQITRIDGQIFSHCPELFYVMLPNNHVNAIERNFLDRNTRMSHFDIRGNKCADVEVVGNRIAIKSRLNMCFENFDNNL
jgi:Leucine-rich repeat (LRR) protein